MNLLEVTGLEVRYGGIRAVKGIDLAVEEGELVCLIGANGAGKSSTLRAISGLLPTAPGAVRYAGRDLAGARAFERVRAGLVMVPEGRGVFPQLTVDENLTMGAYARSDGEIEADRDRIFKLFPRLRERRGQTGGTLSGGEQQMLAIGRALMSRPKLLLLDEPSMGLAPIVVQLIFEVIHEINARGVTCLLVEQNARAALALAGRGYVMESGAITLSGPAAELANDPKVVEALVSAKDRMAHSPLAQLTDREQEILQLLAGHQTNPEIAARLSLTPKTVRNHVSNIFTKLQVASRAEAIVRARDAGLGTSERP